MNHNEAAVNNLNCKVKELEAKKEEIDAQIKAAEAQKEFYSNCIKIEDAIEYLKTLHKQKELNLKMTHQEGQELDPKRYNVQLIVKQLKTIEELIFLLETQNKIA